MKKNKIFKKIKEEKFNNFFKQKDLIIINWGDPIKYSLRVASDVRVCHGNKIILNLSDEFLKKDGTLKDEYVYECLESADVFNDPDSLLTKNIAKVNRLLKGKFAKKVEVSKWLDLAITFSNGVVIQIMQDYLEEGYEYYRFVEFVPRYEGDFIDDVSKQVVVKNKQGVPTLIKED